MSKPAILAALLVGVALSTSAQAQAPRAVTRAEVLANSDKQFAAMDANHDGILTRAELDNFARNQVIGAAMERNKAMFDALDTNHDGKLSREEFAKLIGQLPVPNTGPLYARLDPKHSGKVTRDAFLAAALVNFNTVDTNHDGIVTPAEQRAAATHAGR